MIDEPMPEPFTHADAAAFLRAGGILRHCLNGNYYRLHCNSLMYCTAERARWCLVNLDFSVEQLAYLNDAYSPRLTASIKDKLCMLDTTEEKIDPLPESQRTTIDEYRTAYASGEIPLAVLAILDEHLPDPRNWLEVLALSFEATAKQSDSVTDFTAWSAAARRLRHAIKLHVK